MKLIKTQDAVGQVLCHDMTRIVKGVIKDTAFLRGHVVTEEDIPVLLSIGKDNIYIYENDESMLHENDAAEIMRQVCMGSNPAIRPGGVKEGKIEMFAEADGLFKVDVERLNRINAIENVMIATRHNNYPVKKGDKLAGTRVIPLVIEKEIMERVLAEGGGAPLIDIVPFKKFKAGIVTTGNEVYYERIEDTFTPVIFEKLKPFDIEVIGHKKVYDDTQLIRDSILELINDGADLIICTGGMSVDPDDLTPGGIKATGADIVSYGSPVLPGAMFLLAYYDGRIPIMGLPGCVMFAKATILDIILPRVLAGEKIERKDISSLGGGGLCLSCEQCIYPLCGLGKGV